MLVELSVIPLGKGTHLSEALAVILAKIDASGLRYQLTPEGTCLEGSWDEVMTVVRACHELARKTSEHVITTVKIDDEKGAGNKLIDNVRSVEEKVGRRLART
jgi:uncharacterized protein (TIGR00106 family)